MALAAVVPLADGASQRRAITFTVNSTDDEVDADRFDGLCATSGRRCTLRAAIQQAALFRAGEFPDLIVITVPAGEYRLRIEPAPGSDLPADPRTGDLDVAASSLTRRLEINGAGAGRTVIVQRRGDRVLQIGTGPETAVVVSNLTVTGGRATNGGGIYNGGDGGLTLRAVEVTGNRATDAAGGVYSAQPLVIEDSVISDNHAPAGGGVDHVVRPITITGSTISGNTAVYSGAGILLTDVPTAEIARSLIADNTATGPDPVYAPHGAGIKLNANYAPTVSLRISYSTIRGNNAEVGAGVYTSLPGTLSIENSLIAANTATYGAGIALYGDDALRARPTLILRNSTISGNAAETGGAITRTHDIGCVLAGPDDACSRYTVIHASTIANNTATQGSAFVFGRAMPVNAVVTGTIVANTPPATSCFFSTPPSGGARLTAAGTNIDTGTSCGLGGSDRSSTDPRLTTLANYGGVTLTHSLRDGSPALDTYRHGDCPPIDQRGFGRPGGAACDVGAFERGGASGILVPIPLPSRRDVIGGGIFLMSVGRAVTTSLRSGDFRPCAPGKSIRLSPNGGWYEPRDAQLGVRGELLFRRSGKRAVALGNLLVLLDGTRGRVLALRAPTARALHLFDVALLQYAPQSAVGSLRLSAAAARLLNRLLGTGAFRSGMSCGRLLLQLRIGRDPGFPPPVQPSPPPPPPPPPPQAQTFTLTVSVDPSDGGEVRGPGIDCPSDCSETYAAGTSVTLTRDADDDFEFDHWEGACSGGSSTCGVTMDADKSVTAKFKPKPQQQPECSDGKDNDNDGFTDFSGQDPQCSSPQDDSEST